jgi:hypothetical protein
VTQDPAPTFIRPDGRGVWLYPIVFGYRVGVGVIGEPSMDDLW